MNKIFSLFLLLFFVWTNGNSQGFIYADNEADHLQKVKEWRKNKDAEYKMPDKTMLTEELMKDFEGLKYYEIDYSQRVDGKLKRYTDGRTFKIGTSGGQEYEYLVYGQVSFKLNGKKLKLDVYQGKRSAKSGNKKGALFIPFTDMTSGEETFGGGRYLVLDIPEDDLLVMDFNMAYNPYCVYNPDHSCPIPPKENHLDVKVEAGELMYPLDY
jgi:uncharacterized protein